MIVIFYSLYIWITPAKWSWFWLIVALLMQFVGFCFREFERQADNETNYWKG